MSDEIPGDISCGLYFAFCFHRPANLFVQSTVLTFSGRSGQHIYAFIILIFIHFFAYEESIVFQSARRSDDQDYS